MSKHFVKILSICAFVIILPLAILGTALCVTANSSFKLIVSIVGDDSQHGAEATVRVNDKASDDYEWEFAKGTQVTVSFTATGYNFKNWYDGAVYTQEGLDESKKIEDAGSEYTFTITEDTSLTALCTVQKFNVKYTKAGQEEALGTETLEYGEDLDAYEPDTTSDGWHLVIDGGIGKVVTNTRDFTATGDVTEVTIVTVPETTVVKDVTYTDKDGNELLKTTWTKETVSLLDKDSSYVQEALAKLGKDDYKFVGWELDGQLVDDAKLGEIKNSFDETPITLKMRVEEIVRKTVTFYGPDGETVVFTKNMTKEEFDAFKMSDLPEVKNYVDAGFEFKEWATTLNGETVVDDAYLTSVRQGDFNKEPFNAYLTQTAIEYTVEASYYSPLAAEETTQTLKFSRANDEDRFTVKYSTEGRDNYTFKGLSFNGTLYTYDDAAKDYKNGENLLTNEIIKADPAEHTVDVKAVWEADYKTLDVTVGTTSQDSAKSFYVKNGERYDMYELSETYTFEDAEGQYDLNQALYTILGLENKEFFAKDSDNYTKVELKGVRFTSKTLGGVTPVEFTDVSLAKGLTFSDIIDEFKAENPDVLTNEISVLFIFG